MLDVPVISGAGGGGKSGSGGGLSESADTLKSKSKAQVLDLLCEGEIVGLVNGAKSIYVDDTPLQNADGTFNFQNVGWATTTGTQTQPAISGFDNTSNEIAVAVEAKFGIPVVRTVTNTNVSTVLVTVQMPQLTYMDDKGNLGGTQIDYAIDVQNNGGGFQTFVTESINGKSSSSYERQYRIKLPAGGPWDIRLRRITADSTSSQLNNKTFFKTYTEVIESKMRYPNSALIGLTVDAAQFRAIPRRGYDVKLLKIRIPTNATVRSDGSLSYSGSWDGTFQVAWSCCPAWAFYDMLTVGRYGLGNYISTSQVDKWSLYTISKYCNELVSDGFGGTEPRFSCNILIDTPQEAFKWVNDMASIFRAMPYWQTGAVTVAQDAPASAAYLFHNGNVLDGVFSYEGSSAKARHTVALVTWNDPADMYRQHVEYVEDNDGIARYGVNEIEVAAVGCTSRGQAHRLGRWILYSERYETEICSFKTGGEGALVAPGQVIKVADQDRAGQRLGGRVSSATTNTLTVDSLSAAPTLPATLYVSAPDGSTASYPIASVAGNVITISGTFSTVPVAQAPWVIASASVDAQTFRVVAVTQDDDGNYAVSAVKHNPSKYGYIESNLALQQRNFTSLSPVPSAVASITLSESLYRYQSDVKSKVTASWAASANASAYRIRWRMNSGNWFEDTTTSTEYDILDTTVAKYEVQVTAIGVFGAAAPSAVAASINTLGKTAPPADVTGFSAVVDALIGVTLKWNSVPDLDIDGYEIRNGASWAAGTIVTRVTANSYKVGAVIGSSQTYWIKGIDTTGNYSTNAASVTTSLSAPTAPGSPTATVIDNNVLLKWTASTSTLAVDRYEIRRGSTYAGATVLGAVSGTFMPLFETQSGSYTYWIVGIDIGGNYGTPVNVAATVNQPPDYKLFLNYSSTYGGAMVNALLQDGALWMGVDTTSSFEQHFGNTRTVAPNRFSDSSWNKINCSATDNAVAGPYADLAATITRTAVGNHYLYQSVTDAAPGGRTFTAAVWLKSGTMTGAVNLRLRDGSGGEYGVASVTPTGTWTLYSVTAAFPGGSAANITFIIDPADDTGVAGDTFYVYEATLSEGSSPATYWPTPQDQVTAGFTVFAQPTTTSASYEEVIDYGSSVASAKITLAAAYSMQIGTATITPTISVSNTSSTGPWTDYAGQTEAYVSNFRWIKIRYDLASAGGDDLAKFTSITVRLDAKQKSDFGSINANAADAGGTVVNFNVPFSAVTSINVNAQSTSPVYAVYDFAGGANPTSFKILLFNSSGTRISGTVSWSARGY